VATLPDEDFQCSACGLWSFDPAAHPTPFSPPSFGPDGRHAPIRREVAAPLPSTSEALKRLWSEFYVACGEGGSAAERVRCMTAIERAIIEAGQAMFDAIAQMSQEKRVAQRDVDNYPVAYVISATAYEEMVAAATEWSRDIGEDLLRAQRQLAEAQEALNETRRELADALTDSLKAQERIEALTAAAEAICADEATEGGYMAEQVALIRALRAALTAYRTRGLLVPEESKGE
jgi:hypothetical protein